MNIRGGGCMETGVNSDILGYLKKRQSELEKSKSSYGAL